jgi:aminodeoxychorismate synthase component I
VERAIVVEDPCPPHVLMRRLLAAFPTARRPFLLESAGDHPADGRWSFLGIDPHRTLRGYFDRTESERFGPDGATRVTTTRQHPLDAFADALAETATTPPSDDGPPFRSGAVGALAYDLGELIEPTARTPEPVSDEPLLDMAFYNGVIAYDHASDIAWAFATEAPDAPEPRWLTSAVQLMTRPATTTRDHAPPVRIGMPISSTVSPAAYMKAVRAAKEYIAAGDVYQVNVAQEFIAPYAAAPIDLYAALRDTNPAPFAAFMDMGDYAIASSSPERFLRYDPRNRRIETKPIKGTRPRGHTSGQDAFYEAELMGSVKDAAELVMIVDLERNDLGRICEYGSVRVQALRTVEKFATVQHTVATIEGRVRAGVDVSDILRATFPGGSITGAPKIRAMQVIAELETARRGVYTGSLGYFDTGGAFDLSIAIRTVVARDGHASMWAGSGIVADSDPEEEYHEAMGKASPLFAALGARECIPMSG